MVNKIGLLPYTREDLFGITPETKQITGWEIDKFGIKSLWNKSQGDGVTVAVIDTGCDINHEDIKNNIIDSINFDNPNQKVNDIAGHGTHVSSTIAAENNGTGMVGVAPKTKIIAVKALGDNGNGNLNNIAKAIKWAADRKVDFITMSLGSPYPAQLLESAIDYAASKGCVMFCAAGNSGKNTDIMYPAKYNHTIAIGAINENLDRTDFTCSGDSLDFLAPGYNILGCVPGNKYALMSGTSMSNPFVVGCASLLLSYNRKYKKYKLDTAEDYINVFKQSAKDLQNKEYKGIKKYQGYGILYPVL
jgi:major intracellular serine protease